jgi:hypothetical protein
MASSEHEWQTVACLSDLPGAHILAQRLESDGVAVRVISEPQLLGEGRNCEVQVPLSLARKAQWLLSQAQFTDDELTFLATGELGSAE